MVGVVWVIFALNMNVSVTSDAKVIGSGEYEIKVPEMTVNNIGLMDQRRNHMIGAGVVFLAGVILLVFGSQGEASSAGRRACPFCAESISSSAVMCRFCQKDVPPIAVKEDAHREPQPRHSSGATSIVYCAKCTGMNDGEAKQCFRCGESLIT